MSETLGQRMLSRATHLCNQDISVNLHSWLCNDDRCNDPYNKVCPDHLPFLPITGFSTVQYLTILRIRSFRP